VIAVDTNVLVYAHRSDAPFHEQASRVLRELAEGTSLWAIPWPCVHEFLAKVTHPRIFKNPTPLGRALDQVAEWLRSPTARTISESEGYWDVFADVLRQSQVTGAKVHDARIAALCLAHGVKELWSADRDFSRFGVRLKNPLTAET
jgi:toxin-antitoxin system PIN domain toxin